VLLRRERRGGDEVGRAGDRQAARPRRAYGRLATGRGREGVGPRNRRVYFWLKQPGARAAGIAGAQLGAEGTPSAPRYRARLVPALAGFVAQYASHRSSAVTDHRTGDFETISYAAA